MVSPAEARGRPHHYSPRHHYHHAHYHRTYHHAAAAQDVPQANGSSSWNQQGAWNGNWGPSDDRWQPVQSQSWGDPQGTWGGSAGWSQQARAERSDAVGAIGTTETGGGLKELVARHAREAGIPVALADAVVRIESGYNPRARNRSGAMGLMQIKAQTARGQGFSGSASALLNPETNLRYAMRYLATAYRMSGGDVCGTVMRYQSGHYARRMSGADRSYCSRARHLMARA
jgi:hypothetical protein